MILSAGWPESETGENMMCPTIAPLSSAISDTSGCAWSRRASTRLASAGVSNADTFTAWTAAQSLCSSARISMFSLKTYNAQIKPRRAASTCMNCYTHEPDSVLDCFNAQSPKLLKVVLHGFELFGRVLIRDLTRDPTGSKLALKPSSIARLNDEPRVFCVGSVV